MTTALPDTVAVYRLPWAERRSIDDLLAGLGQEFRSVEDPAFLLDARRLACSCLPVELIRFLDRFSHQESAPLIAVVGLDVDDDRIGPTPPHWRAQADPGSTLREELFFVLVGSVIGDVFSWATLQEGRLVQNVLPIRNQEAEQSGHGSHATLAWHTEDGFHPYRCDYLGLMGLRNDDLVPTTFARMDGVKLSESQRRALSQPRFLIRPDNEHLHQRARDRGREAPQPLHADWTEPAPTSVLFGDPAAPYLRIDPYFMSVPASDEEARRALAALQQALEEALEDLVIRPGAVCFVDNYRAVHGRAAFLPRYDGRDRWLKKLLLTRDLRKSRAARREPDGRVVIPTAFPREPDLTG